MLFAVRGVFFIFLGVISICVMARADDKAISIPDDIAGKVGDLQKSIDSIKKPAAHEFDHFKNYDWPGDGRNERSIDMKEYSSHIKKIEKITLYVLVSFSMSVAALQSLSTELKKINRVLTFRGFYHNDMHLTYLKLQEIGVTAEVDPVIFRIFHVTQVPCFIMVKHDADGHIQEIAQVEGLVDAYTALEFMRRNKLNADGAAVIDKVLRGLGHDD